MKALHWSGWATDPRLGAMEAAVDEGCAVILDGHRPPYAHSRKDALYKVEWGTPPSARRPRASSTTAGRRAAMAARGPARCSVESADESALSAVILARPTLLYTRNPSE